jgi:hypothetical protein
MILFASGEGARGPFGETPRTAVDAPGKRPHRFGDCRRSGDRNVERAENRGIDLPDPVPVDGKTPGDDSSPENPEAGNNQEPADDENAAEASDSAGTVKADFKKAKKG